MPRHEHAARTMFALLHDGSAAGRQSTALGLAGRPGADAAAHYARLEGCKYTASWSSRQTHRIQRHACSKGPCHHSPNICSPQRPLTVVGGNDVSEACGGHGRNLARQGEKTGHGHSWVLVSCSSGPAVPGSLAASPLTQCPPRLPFKTALQNGPSKPALQNCPSKLPSKLPFETALRNCPSKLPFKTCAFSMGAAVTRSPLGP